MPEKEKVVALADALENLGKCAAELFLGCIPEEAVKHLHAARKERLLALRAFLDAEIARLEEKEKKAEKRGKTRKVKVE